MRISLVVASCSFVVASCAVGCQPSVADEASAERAYLGLDGAVERALNLGFAGYNAASSANIATQEDDGATKGTMSVGGQVDQGASNNKGLRLEVALADYADEAVKDENDEDIEVSYDTGETPLALDLQLKSIPDGDYDGTFTGDVAMAGDLEGVVTLNLQLSGDLEADADSEGGTQRATTIVTGTATSDYGAYDVDIER